MRASFLQNVEYKRWVGPQQPNSVFRQFAFSEPVPKGRVWIVLGVSAIDTFPNNESLWLLLIPPPSSYSAGLNNFFANLVSSDKNSPPVSQGVQVSVGGAVSPENSGESVGNKGYVNLISRRFRRFVVPPEWCMAVLQAQNGGGSANDFISFSAMIIEQSLN
jgi:hypothetical protein